MKASHVIVGLGLCVSWAAIAAPAHEHGAAKLDVSVEGERLSLGLEMPLDNLVGFEHVPRTEKQKIALAESLKLLKNGAELFTPSAEAGCKLESAEVSDPFPGGKANPDGHADVDADYVFQCSKPAALRSLATSLFSRFKHLNRIDAQRATPQGQGKARLTPKQTTLSW